MMLCVTLSLSSCVKTLATDSFCQVYEPVIQQKGEGSISATSGVKRRLLGNEQTYRGLCKTGK